MVILPVDSRIADLAEKYDFAIMNVPGGPPMSVVMAYVTALRTALTEAQQKIEWRGNRIDELEAQRSELRSSLNGRENES